MAIFNSYDKLPEGKWYDDHDFILLQILKMVTETVRHGHWTSNIDGKALEIQQQSAMAMHGLCTSAPKISAETPEYQHKDEKQLDIVGLSWWCLVP